SLIYDPSISGTINPSADTDSFTINLDPGQVVTILVTPGSGLRPSVTLRDPSNAVLASNTAGAAGQNALITTAPAATAGTYTITVSSAGGTTGTYTVQLFLNAAKEFEGAIGAANYNASAVPFTFTEITATGTHVLPNTDDGATTIAIPFTFSLYG